MLAGSVDFQTLIQLPYQIFTIIDPYHMMSLVFDSKIEMWSVNFINIIYILITKTVCSSLYTWAVNKNCMEGFLTEWWDVRGKVSEWIKMWGKERMWRNGKCKERGGQCKEKGKCDDKGEQNPYIQFLCTAHLYSDKHTVVLNRTCSLHSTQPHYPSIQFSCTAHLYSTKHTVVLIRTCSLHSTQPH